MREIESSVFLHLDLNSVNKNDSTKIASSEALEIKTFSVLVYNIAVC